MTDSTATVNDDNSFRARHIGPDRAAHAHMLGVLGYPSVDSLIDAAVPRQIRCADGLRLPSARSEQQVLDALRAMAGRNDTRVQMIGLGYYDTITPAVLRRNMLESPAWYTAYTPYQPEISQGRLEALLTFQTVIEDLTALPVAGASLLDEATAVMEAVLLMRRASKATSKAEHVVLDADCLPQTLAVVRGRAAAVGIEVLVVDTADGLPDVDAFGVVFQSPGASGAVRNLAPLIAAAHERGMLTTVAADLLSLTLVAAPGEQGADIAVGSAQRFGVPLFFGGPHAGYMAVRTGLERMLPGRLVGVSVDVDGQPAYRLALQTREQHIRRDKATSNICTAQALLANIAAMFAAYHGPEGLRAIATRIHRHAVTLAAGLQEAGYEIIHDRFFDTVTVLVPACAQQVVAAADSAGINLRLVDADHVGIACDECTTDEVIRRVLDAFGAAPPAIADGRNALPVGVLRTSEYLTHPVFHRHRSETAMMRFLRELSDKDLALDRTMIPLGSCTMKLNAAAEMEPVSWPGFAGMHPYAPAEQTAGYLELIGDLESWLAEITGYDRVSLQPNAGSQGEIAGLLAVNAYHRSRGDLTRDVCLIPQSAHGTNAASAVLAGMRVVVVRTALNGNIDIDDLRSKIAANEGTVAAIMLTYPSTHGVYESDVRTVCDLVHRAGGQVYVDGANLNALVGLAKPGEFGGDVSHLNLHKTFCIPHGGGGPGVGPVAVRAHLAPFLPGDPLSVDGPAPVSAANHGSAGILPITWAYLALMGSDGLTAATKSAVLAANYLAASLAPHYPVLYTGESGLVAHECILDLREITKRTGVTAEDVAKRLIDYGFHAPTLSFPVNGTLMVEPTESEGLAELDRFVTAMISIYDEISRVDSGEWALDQSSLRQAPHTAEQVTATEWMLPYTRQYAAYPVAAVRHNKYWPPVRRIDGVHGDRNLACSCPPTEAFQTDAAQVVASPLLDEHRELGATFTDFAGWAMPLKYGSELAEHRAVRESAGLFDLSHMGEIAVTGAQSAEALDFALVGEASKIAVGRAKYSLICDTGGGVIDDLVVYRLADDDFLVVANAANAGTVTRELVVRAEEFDAVVDDQSALTALIAVQGPASEDIVASLVPGDQREAVRSLKYYSVIDAKVDGVNVLLARTGYTGEDGFELYVPNVRAVALWRSLLAATAAAGGSPAGLASRDTLRLEAGMALYGHELSQATNPFQAGLGKVVKFGKNFVGREALQHVSELSADKVLVGLKGSTRRAARPGYTVHKSSVGAPVGTVTSGALSPTLGYPIALAYVDATLAQPGTVVKVDIRGNSEQFEVTPTPFYRRK